MNTKRKEKILYLKELLAGWFDEDQGVLEIAARKIADRVLSVCPALFFDFPILKTGRCCYIECDESSVIIYEGSGKCLFVVKIQGTEDQKTQALEALQALAVASVGDRETTYESFVATAVGGQMEDWKVAYFLQNVPLQKGDLNAIFLNSLDNEWKGTPLRTFLNTL